MGIRTAAGAPVSLSARGYLAELERDWPVGGRVRHVDSGWVGTVTADPCRLAPGVTASPEPAHALLFEPPYCGQGVPAVVCVAWDRPEAMDVAWVRRDRLRRVHNPGNHTREHTHNPGGPRPPGDVGRKRSRTRRLPQGGGR